ncbi:hypothetical protein M153_3600002263 [Pseudoloma neurophilia]|uniref:Uncharacterized protein n=1 Tax=Pseudoloma neurophilia TaxID=146866 RepID=A0A0R0M206_9MICR|nr:hypothetical protein M153_3600002263 [Pseudoloma neurophilia]
MCVKNNLKSVRVFEKFLLHGSNKYFTFVVLFYWYSDQAAISDFFHNTNSVVSERIISSLPHSYGHKSFLFLKIFFTFLLHFFVEVKISIFFMDKNHYYSSKNN